MVKKKSKTPEHPLLAKWAPVFDEAQKDGIPIIRYKNPITGENDITTLVFDERLLQTKQIQGTTLETDYVVRPPEADKPEVENNGE